jgi:lipoprotein-anchoring transpeptidase ErfK/SrfK
MRAGDGTRRRVTRRVSRPRYLLRRVTVILALTAVVLAVVNLVDAVTTDGGDEQVAHAEPEQQIVAAELSVDAPARPAARAAQPRTTPTSTPSARPVDDKAAATARLPAGSGSGKRVVYDISAQQVWLVRTDDVVARTYPVSGSRYDQLASGTYRVFSRSRHATSWHGTESMEFMVRFYRGARANIGFHDIPVDTSSGEEVQTLAELGTPLSDGCIRQDVVDAKALWTFAPEGTPVVVLH